MGNDGGSIPTRRELVKEAARSATTTELKESQTEQQEYYWTTCPLSQRVLATPIVSDSSGKLYNKDAILEFLLPAGDGTPGMSKSDNEEVLDGRVKGLRDVVEVKFEVEKEASPNGNGGRRQGEKRVCPVTRKELGPGTKAVYLVPCGHAFSDAAIKEISGENCLQCNEPFTSENIIPILPAAAADIERLALRAKALREKGLTHSLKKAPGSSKKRKKNGDPIANGGDDVAPVLEGKSVKAISKPGTPQPGSGTAMPKESGIKNAATASLTAKVLKDEEERHKKRKLGMNDNLKSLFSSGGSGGSKGTDFMTRGYSIPADAKYK